MNERKVIGVGGGRYSVDCEGVVWRDGLPLKAIGGVGVNIEGKRVNIAYLVARAWVANPRACKWVRHRNGDVTDNRAANLEWCDEKEERRRGPKPIERWCGAWDAEGECVGMWRNVSEASMETWVGPRAVRDACNGRQKTAGGLVWRWC